VVVTSATEAQLMVQVAYESPVSVIGVDTEYRYGADAPVILSKKQEWWDRRSIRPFCISLAILSDADLFRFVVDVRQPAVISAVQRLFDLPVRFCAHSAGGDLAAWWSLGLREPRELWDTYVAERALSLGQAPRSATKRHHSNGSGDKQREEAAGDMEAARLTLHATASRHGVTVSSQQFQQKPDFQSGFLTKPFDAPLTGEESAYAAADAQLTAEIYLPQRAACDQAGITPTLDRIVMAWNVTAAEMTWTGVLMDPERCGRFLASCRQAQFTLQHDLSAYGITNPNSTPQIGTVLIAACLADAFPKTDSGGICTKDAVLEERENLHPVIPMIRRWRKVKQWSADPAVTGTIIGCDRRIHADIRVLGADSGRTQSRLPNLMGIGKVFRPLVVASPGKGIGDADLCQIEVAIAAAVFGDQALIDDFNRGDVYVSMAKRVFQSTLTDEDRALSDCDFKVAHKAKRNQVKPLVLGIIYGKSVESLACDLKISIHEAQQLWNSFAAYYPVLCQGMEDAREQPIRRGYAYMTGLRRLRPANATVSNAEKRSLGNACIQGTAALVFYDAGNRLRKLYRAYDAHLILPVHDAFVFEAPLAHLSSVAELTKTVMTMTVQEWFPNLRPRVEVNIAHPECWNHEGHADSLEHFAADPMYKL